MMLLVWKVIGLDSLIISLPFHGLYELIFILLLNKWMFLARDVCAKGVLT